MNINCSNLNIFNELIHIHQNYTASKICQFSSTLNYEWNENAITKLIIITIHFKWFESKILDTIIMSTRNISDVMSNNSAREKFLKNDLIYLPLD